MNKEIRTIREDLKEMAQKEAFKMWRLARKAIKKGVSAETVKEIRDEAWMLNDEMISYPERLLMWEAENRFKFAFK